jgi:acetoacetate decarboxylase
MTEDAYLCRVSTLRAKRAIVAERREARPLSGGCIPRIIPHVDAVPRICELLRYYMEDVTVKGAWAGPAAIQLIDHAPCDLARLPVREVVSVTHHVTDLTLGLGEVVFDYLEEV